MEQYLQPILLASCVLATIALILRERRSVRFESIPALRQLVWWQAFVSLGFVAIFTTLTVLKLWHAGSLEMLLGWLLIRGIFERIYRRKAAQYLDVDFAKLQRQI